MRARLNLRRILAVLALSVAAVAAGGVTASGHAAHVKADSVWDFTVVGDEPAVSEEPGVASVMDSVWD